MYANVTDSLAAANGRSRSRRSEPEVPAVEPEPSVETSIALQRRDAGLTPPLPQRRENRSTLALCFGLMGSLPGARWHRLPTEASAGPHRRRRGTRSWPRMSRHDAVLSWHGQEAAQKVTSLVDNHGPSRYSGCHRGAAPMLPIQPGGPSVSWTSHWASVLDMRLARAFS